MRDFKSMKRQRGRNRKPGGGGGQGHGNNPNRAFDSNGPEGIKVRGNAQHVYERYQQLARDATSAGDRVLAENFLQHAEHYFRLIRAMQPNRPVAEIAARDATAAGFDIDFEDESGVPQVDPGFLAEQQAHEKAQADGEHREQRDDRDFRRDRDNRDRDNRDRDSRDRSEGRDRDRDFNRDRDNRDRDRNRDDRQRDDRPREDRAREDRPREDRSREDRPREDRPREDRPREDRAEGQNGEGRRESRRERFERQRGDRRPRYGEEDRSGDPLAVVQPGAEPLVAREEEASPRLRSDNGDESHMPAFLGRAAPTLAETAPDAPVEKPKRAPRKRKAAAETAGEDA
jgi:hypothetical protein